MKKVMSFSLLDYNIFLKEDIDSNYWLIQEKDEVNIQVSQYTDLKLALDCFHLVCETIINNKELVA
jgi:hypothetical protein